MRGECAKFRGSRAIVGLVDSVPSCYRALVGISWVQNLCCVYSWVSNFFLWVSVGLKFFLVGISWLLNIFSWVFCRSRLFSRMKFVSPISFLVIYFVIQGFLVAGCMSKSDKNRKTGTHLKPRILFKSISTIANCLY